MAQRKKGETGFNAVYKGSKEVFTSEQCFPEIAKKAILIKCFVAINLARGSHPRMKANLISILASPPPLVCTHRENVETDVCVRRRPHRGPRRF